MDDGAAKLGMHFVAMGPEELAKQMDKDVVNSTFAEPGKMAASLRSPITRRT